VSAVLHRKIEEPDYCMISVWEKCITTVTAIPVYFGDGMSNLTGSVAPIDHAAYGHVKSHQKVENVHIKANYDPVTNPLLVCGAACRVGRARASSMRFAALSRCSSNARAEYWCRSSQRRKGRWIWSEALFM
jgi:hypothetical protein